MYTSSKKPTDRPTAVAIFETITPAMVLEPCRSGHASQLLPTKVATALSSNRGLEGSYCFDNVCRYAGRPAKLKKLNISILKWTFLCENLLSTSFFILNYKFFRIGFWRPPKKILNFHIHGVSEKISLRGVPLSLGLWKISVSSPLHFLSLTSCKSETPPQTLFDWLSS